MSSPDLVLSSICLSSCRTVQVAQCNISIHCENLQSMTTQISPCFHITTAISVIHFPTTRVNTYLQTLKHRTNWELVSMHTFRLWNLIQTENLQWKTKRSIKHVKLVWPGSDLDAQISWPLEIICTFMCIRLLDFHCVTVCNTVILGSTVYFTHCTFCLL